MSNTTKHAVKAIYDNAPTEPKQLAEYLNLLSERTASNDFNYYKSAIVSDFVTVETRFTQPLEPTGKYSTIIVIEPNIIISSKILKYYIT